MKCNIVKDLLPLYCDKLTSQDSNEEIEKHLHECEECNAVYESMNKKEENIEVPEKDVKPLKKVKKRTALKIIATVLGTAVVLFGVFMFVFWGVIPISSDKLHYTATIKQGTSYYWDSKTIPDDDNNDGIPDAAEADTHNVLWIEFDADCSCARYETNYEFDINGITDKSITVYPQIKLPFDDRGKNPSSFSYGVGSVEEGDILTIRCRDKTETIDLYQLYQDTVKNQK